MADPLPSQRRRFPLALVASLAIHAVLVAPFLIQLPERQAEVPVEQSVAVEIVPEPEKPDEPEKPAEPPKPQEQAPAQQPPPAAQAPSAETRPDAAAAEAPPKGAPPPFEASAPEKPDTPPDPVDMPKPADEASTPNRLDNARPADRPASDVSKDPGRDAAAVAEPDRPAPPDLSHAPPDIPGAGKASDAVLTAGPSADAAEAPPADPKPAPRAEEKPDVAAEAEPSPAPPATALPSPEADRPMTLAEQAAFIPPKPAVPETKPSAVEAPKPAKALYAKDMLADPRVRGALNKLPPNKRIVQMCAIEAGEQVRHSGAGLTPDLLKAFGRNGGLITGTHLSASGGAVRSRGGWHDMRFECTVNAAFDAITDFRFALGERVPKADWGPRGLMAE